LKIPTGRKSTLCILIEEAAVVASGSESRERRKNWSEARGSNDVAASKRQFKAIKNNILPRWQRDFHAASKKKRLIFRRGIPSMDFISSTFEKTPGDAPLDLG